MSLAKASLSLLDMNRGLNFVELGSLRVGILRMLGKLQAGIQCMDASACKERMRKGELNAGFEIKYTRVDIINRNRVSQFKKSTGDSICTLMQ